MRVDRLSGSPGGMGRGADPWSLPRPPLSAVARASRCTIIWARSPAAATSGPAGSRSGWRWRSALMIFAAVGEGSRRPADAAARRPGRGRRSWRWRWDRPVPELALRAAPGRSGRRWSTRCSLLAHWLVAVSLVPAAPRARAEAQAAGRGADPHPARRAGRPGRRAAPDRARPPRRRAGAAGRAEHAARPRRGAARPTGPSDRELSAAPATRPSAAIAELRDLARGIAPPVLADRGLPAALEALGRARADPGDRDRRARPPARGR